MTPFNSHLRFSGRLAALSVAGAFVVTAAAVAQGSPAPAAINATRSAVAGQAAAMGHVLGAGDVVSIDIADMPESSTKSVRVGTDGTLELPLVGAVKASGLSVAQLRTALVERARKYVTDPVVTVNVVSNGSSFVSVLGEVNAPGLHTLDGPRTLVEVISEAGGVKADAGPRVIVTRNANNGPLPALDGVEPAVSGGNARLTLSLKRLLASEGDGSDLAVKPGDVISIPKEQLVYVVGDVKRAGGFPMSSSESVSVLQAMSLAEGSNANAALKAAKILRPTATAGAVPTEVPINMEAILAGRAPDQPLFANDVLFIPRSAAKSGTKRAAEIMLQVATGVAIYR